MAKFITGKALEDTIYDIIWNADQNLLIISPFIRLDDYFKTLFNHHIDNAKIHLIIVFGKNEGKVQMSLSRSDFDYFKNFRNVSIIYVPNLHAKYYGNDLKGVITSMNLYDYSFKNNIEFGVSTGFHLIGSLTTNSDDDARNAAMETASSNEAVFIKRPVYEKKLFGKNYIKSETLLDTTDKFYSTVKSNQSEPKRLFDFPESLEQMSSSTEMPRREEIEANSVRPVSKPINTKRQGFCIRTGVPIPFNVKEPMSVEAQKSWKRFGNPDYKEKYCHFSGEESNGETCVSRPILKRNWPKAKEAFNL